MFTELWDGRPIRLLGSGASNLEEENMKVFDLFHLDEIEKEESINKAINSIDEKYGKNAIKKGIN